MTLVQFLVVLVVAILLTGVTVFGLILRERSHLSTPISPTPTSTPLMPSDPSMEMAKMMMEMAERQMTQTAKLMETMMVGREPTPESPLPTSLTSQPTMFDYESTPLSPGIEGVISREVEEDQLAASMRERRALQERMAELQAEEQRLSGQSTLDDLSPGPWQSPTSDTGSPT